MPDLDIFTDEQLADLVRAEASALWREHRKLEMGVTAIVAPVSAFIVGCLVYLFASAPGTVPWGALAVGIAAAILSIPLTLVVIYGYYRFILAPSNLYFKTYRTFKETELLLGEEQAKNALPELKGEIEHWSSCGRFDKAKLEPIPGGLLINVRISFWNARPAVTTVKNFYLKFVVGNKSYVSLYAEREEMLDEQPSFELIADEATVKIIRVYANKGDRFPNLFKPPLIAEHNIVHTGQLQFQIKDVNLFHLVNGLMGVGMVDTGDKTHWTTPILIEKTY